MNDGIDDLQAARTELMAVVAPLFPTSELEWRQENRIYIDTRVQTDPERRNQHAREIVLRFERAALQNFAAAEARDRQRQSEAMRRTIATAMRGYDPATSAPKGAALEPFVIHCGDALFA